MKTIKMLAATVALSLGAATAAFAQPPAGADGPPGRGYGGHGGGPGGPGNIERLSVLLDLDAYQKQEVERVLTEQRDAALAQRKANRESGERPTFDEMQARREQRREDTFAKLKNVLSDTQMTKLKLLMEPPAGGPGGRRGPPREGAEKRAGDHDTGK
jgi:Spy/CpxP family protein refolding chaperone